ncbi:hypothetical protein [Anoxybacillus sp. EFIL]|uniref:hypothetical protein n=1 Tax=Anoxybacillus sp. EFIL TaxID=2508869 RepID=UPI00148DCF25|nr:hypothetical protein [Anoxybacillus sp. EFIL]NNU96164.1 hypothetical protein [Anoxybacillus sp. EFIL]
MGIQRLQPVSGETDWMKTTPIITKFSTINSTYETAVNVTGKGILTGIAGTSRYENTAVYTFVEIIVDGTTLITDLRVNSLNNGSVGIPMNIRFNNSLKVNVRSTAGGYTVEATITYVLV